MAQTLTISRPDAAGGSHTPLPAGASRHVLHVLPGFGVGGIQVRLARVANALGPRFRHTILSLNGDTSCRERLDAALDVVVEHVAPRRGLLTRLDASARRIRRAAPDLLATYNWGAIEWAMANGLLVGARHCHFEDGFGPDEIDRPLRRRGLVLLVGARHCHFEDGFGPDEIDRPLRRRGMLRRLALMRSDAVVVPSHTLERIAVGLWHLPASRVVYLPNGVELGNVNGSAVDAPLFARRDDEIIVGTVAPLRPEKNLGRLLAAFARLDDQSTRLVIAGDGSERAALEAFADALGIADRVLFLGAVAEPQRALALFDIFTLSSDTEQMPMTVLEAMAASLPVAAVDVGDIKHMVAPPNRTFIVPRGEVMLASALAALIADTGRRHAIGRLNHAQVGAKYPFARMLEGYARLFEGRR